LVIPAARGTIEESDQPMYAACWSVSAFHTNFGVIGSARGDTLGRVRASSASLAPIWLLCWRPVSAVFF